MKKFLKIINFLHKNKQKVHFFAQKLTKMGQIWAKNYTIPKRRYIFLPNFLKQGTFFCPKYHQNS